MTTTHRSEQTLEFFDQLIEQNVHLEELVERAARFADASVGVVFSGSPAIAKTSTGAEIDPTPPPRAAVLESASGHLVWIDDSGQDRQYTRFMLRRVAVAVQALSRQTVQPPPHRSTPLEALIRRGTSEPLLLESLRRLRLQPADPVRLQVAEGSQDVWSAHLDAQRDRRLLADAHAQGLGVALWGALEGESTGCTIPDEGLIVAESATSPARDVRRAFEDARSALRFAPVSSLTVEHSNRMIRYEDLGSFAALTTLSRESIEALPDVRLLDEFASEHGSDVLVVLEAFAASESQRRAAALLHRHHNSVSYWVKRAEARLGFRFDEPAQRSRLFLALVLRHLRGTAATAPASRPGADIRL